MKKIIVLIMLVTLCISAYADKGDVTVGVQLYDNPKVSPNLFGGGASVRYEFSDYLRGRLAASVVSGSDIESGVDAALDIQWAFNPSNKFVIYVAAGVGYMTIEDISSVSFLFGPGFDYYINDNWGINLDIKGQIVSEGYGLPITLGVTYTF